MRHDKQRKYPAPIRLMWSVMVEFNDGNVIFGTSDDDLVERWGRLLGWFRGSPLSPLEVRQTVKRHLLAFYDADLGLDVSKASNTEFLEAVAETRNVQLIRK